MPTNSLPTPTAAVQHPKLAGAQVQLGNERTNELLLSKFTRWIHCDQMSLRFDPETPEVVIEEALSDLLHAETRLQFYIGDLINFRAERWKQGRYKRLLEETDRSYWALSKMAYVAGAVSPERRREDLGYTFHQEVAPLPPEEQTRFLLAAAKHGWRKSELRRQIRFSRLLPAKAPLTPYFGAALDFPGLRCEPINEAGVVYLFALLSGRMEFDVQAVHTGYPDCFARRRVDERRWKDVRIEFEFQSKNFHTHQHAAEHCDLIICWEHNWPMCPIEVIALKDVVQQLGR